MSYDPSAAGLDLQALTKQTSSPAPPSILPPTDDTRDGFCSVAADTGETVQSRPAPGIFALGMYPSPTRGAARVWTASTAGYARISAEAWREAAGVGDGSVAEIYLIQKRRAGATVTPLVEPRRLTRPDEPFRVAPDDLGRIRVQRGDQIVFGVHRGTAPNNNALWDTTLFQSSVHLSSR